MMGIWNEGNLEAEILKKEKREVESISEEELRRLQVLSIVDNEGYFAPIKIVRETYIRPCGRRV